MRMKINAQNYLPKSENSITHGLPNAFYQRTNNIITIWKARDGLAFAYVFI
jgi:hypothetical protein